MVVALDAMGGDHAPEAVVEGALLAAEHLAQQGNSLVLIGQLSRINPLLGQGHPAIATLAADEVIEMGEHPAKAFTQKPNSSIALGFQLLASNQVQAFCSAGNTGAMLVGSMLSVKPIPGIMRPAIAGFCPKINGKTGVILDVGANAEVKPEVLAQFGEMGSLYAQHVLGIASPKVGLVNVGAEEQKGTTITQAAHMLLKANDRINFIGNLEGRDIFNSDVDVVVCDGFVGNVILKLSEKFYEIMQERGLPRDPFFDELNYERHGGSPIIGVNSNVLIGHGISSPTAIMNMILQAQQMIKAEITTKIRASLSVVAPTH
jgi:phosphate acyltransferase